MVVSHLRVNGAQLQRRFHILTQKKERGGMMGRVVEVVGDERRGFHKIVPCLAHASKSEEGFDWKAFEDVVNDFLGNKRRLPITYNHCTLTLHGVTWKGKEQISDVI